MIIDLVQATTDKVGTTVAAVRDAFANWPAGPPVERSAALLRTACRMEAESDQFAHQEVLNCGRTINCARKDELPFIADICTYFAEFTCCMQGLAAGMCVEGRTSVTRNEPVAAIALFAPRNYRPMMMIWKIAPAIAAGDSVVFKPSGVLHSPRFSSHESWQTICRQASKISRPESA